jgi:initiation factor 1A
MPARNQRGGKGFKKGKKPSGGDDLDFPAGKLNRADGEWQDYGRVLRLLGDRRVLCFCNDGNERIAKIRGALCKAPKKKIITTGDIVLLSFREFSGRSAVAAPAEETGMALTTATGRKEIADLLEKYERHHWDEIRALPDIHPRLLVATMTTGPDEIDDLFSNVEKPEATAATVASDTESSDGDVDVDAI